MTDKPASRLLLLLFVDFLLSRTKDLMNNVIQNLKNQFYMIRKPACNQSEGAVIPAFHIPLLIGQAAIKIHISHWQIAEQKVTLDRRLVQFNAL